MEWYQNMTRLYLKHYATFFQMVMENSFQDKNALELYRRLQTQ
jgi:hypothetical protein